MTTLPTFADSDVNSEYCASRIKRSITGIETRMDKPVRLGILVLNSPDKSNNYAFQRYLHRGYCVHSALVSMHCFDVCIWGKHVDK